MAGAYYPFSHKYADLPFIAWGWSLAYCIIYFILALVLIVRIARRPAQMAVYVWLLLLCAGTYTVTRGHDFATQSLASKGLFNIPAAASPRCYC